MAFNYNATLTSLNYVLFCFIKNWAFKANLFFNDLIVNKIVTKVYKIINFILSTIRF